MSPKHLRAVAALGRAFAAASKAGLAVCGMDDTLYAYPADEFDRLAGELPSAYEVQQQLIADDESEHIEDHGVYRESGGW